MKRIVNLIVGVVLGAVLTVPLAAAATENATLRERVSDLEARTELMERRLNIACNEFRVWKPRLYTHLDIRGAC